MRYPIIDNLIYPYLRNGWTGLELNPVNIWDEVINVGALTPSGDIDTSLPNRLTTSFIPVAPNTTYLFHSTTSYKGRSAIYDSNKTLITYFADFPPAPTSVSDNGNFSYTIPSNGYFIRWTFSPYYTPPYQNNVSVNYPSTYTGYISQEQTENSINDFKNDISHSFKLPLQHYFPHSVIDALISAADGQQTAEETEILRHYLTPLGIGGI